MLTILLSLHWKGANNLNGTVPSELSAMESLEVLRLHTGGLHGTIPASIGHLGRLERLSFSGNDLTGTIPESFAALSNLKAMNINSNQLTGTIPEGLTMMAQMEKFNFIENELTGTIPEFNFRSSAKYCDFRSNMLEGTIPESLFSLLQLELLDLSGNNLTGTLPTVLGTMVELETLYLEFNSLTGSIPSEIGSLERLDTLHLYNNALNGTIPTELGLNMKLTRVDFNDNTLTGTIPSELGRLTLLEDFHVASNELTGTVPSTLGLTNAWSIELNNNSITGSLDSIFCNQSQAAFDAFDTLKADCNGAPPEVDCSCCTVCCDDASGQCSTDSMAFCERSGNTLEMEFLDYDTLCECLDEGYTLACVDTACQFCSEDGTVCGVDVAWGSTFYGPDLETSSWYHSFQYVTGRDELITYEVVYGAEPGNYTRHVSINGEECNSVTERQCSNGSFELVIDCENVVEGATFDSCLSRSGVGVLEMFTAGFDSETCVPLD